MITDTHGVLIYVNPAWCEIYGFTFEEAVGSTPRLLHSGQQDKNFYNKMWSDIRQSNKGYWKGELVNRTKEGRLIPVLLTIAPHRTEGRVVGYMGIAVDLRTQKELEQQVVRQDRMASVGLMASGLAHEIGTPLGVVRGRAELMKMKLGDSDQDFSNGLEVIMNQIDRVSKLINSLLRFSRDEVGEASKIIPLAPLVDEVVTFLEKKFERRSIQLNIRVPDSIQVRGDGSSIQQIFINLLINAIHAIEKSIDDGRDVGHQITVRASEANQKVEIDIEDSGCGIQQEDLSRVFKAFFTTKGVGEGTGLGLSIVEKLVTEMGGDISAYSQVGIGTCFKILLPTAEPASN